MRVGHHRVGVDVVHVLVSRPTLLVERPRVGGLEEQHDVVEDRPQEGHAELAVLLQLLAPWPHTDVVMREQQPVNLVTLLRAVHVDARPANANDPHLLLPPELLDERQEREVPAVGRGLVVYLPLAGARVLQQLDGQLEGDHEDGVVVADAHGAFQLLDERQLLVLVQSPDGGASHLHVGLVVMGAIVLLFFDCAVLPVQALVVLYDHFGAGGREGPVPSEVLPRVRRQSTIGRANYDVLVLHLLVQRDRDRSRRVPDGEDVLAGRQREAIRRIPSANARVTADDPDYIAERNMSVGHVEVHMGQELLAGCLLRASHGRRGSGGGMQAGGGSPSVQPGEFT
mmetsp:Transcript_29906/g.76087  ORF Transcript_29906/g.76087 Transcript_29906/m.76087 type:complete len:341 (+) Transcript_29906:1821-2843(+)